MDSELYVENNAIVLQLLDNRSKLYIPHMFRGSTDTVHGESEREDALPWICHRLNQTTFSWTAESCLVYLFQENQIEGYFVHVPVFLGKLIPEIDSINKDFPALCAPITITWGRSTSRCALWIMQEKHM